VIVSGGGDGTVRIWELAGGAPIGEPLRGHEGAVSAVAVGELDGRPVIVSGGYDGTVRIWELAGGAPIGEPLRGHDDLVLTVAVGELDGRPVIVSGGDDQTVRIWELAGGAPIGEPVWIGSSVVAVVLNRNTCPLGTSAGVLLLDWYPTAK
jgi:WD40 repeat protein